jgi:hypothetical protein
VLCGIVADGLMKPSRGTRGGLLLMQRVNVSRRLRRKCKREMGSPKRYATFLLIQQKTSLRSACEALQRHGLLGRLEDNLGLLQNTTEHRMGSSADRNVELVGGRVARTV